MVIDELRKARGHSVILRGHDFLLRNGPRESLVHADGERGPNKRNLQIIVRQTAPSYVPLRCHSYYSFLDSTLSPSAIVELAKLHELPAVALTDTGNLHGVVEFVQAAQTAGIKPLIGAELTIASQPAERSASPSGTNGARAFQASDKEVR